MRSGLKVEPVLSRTMPVAGPVHEGIWNKTRIRMHHCKQSRHNRDAATRATRPEEWNCDRLLPLLHNRENLFVLVFSARTNRILSAHSISPASLSVIGSRLAPDIESPNDVDNGIGIALDPLCSNCGGKCRYPAVSIRRCRVLPRRR